ncbi:MAG: SEC-C metal-binding domain-containing protein, partial [Chloroflexota bacterium]|nr:SEC-C metal-binding domain-containing protein [Chloroflexota bacterium]
IGDEYYEIAGSGETDYNKLGTILGLPPEMVKQISDEEMGYAEAQDFLFPIVREGFERDQAPRLEKLEEYLAQTARSAGADLSTVAINAIGDAAEIDPRHEELTRNLLATIGLNFPLTATTAARYVEAESGGNGSKSMMGTSGSDAVADELQVQLEGLYIEIERTLGDVFVETNSHMPLISLVDNRLPRSVYRQIEEQLGVEGLEQVENIPLAQLSAEPHEIVKNAFVRWQESDLMLRVIDYLWTRHLTTMEGLRHSIGLQAYGQKDPLVQYRVKAYELFDELKAEIRQLVVMNVLLMGEKAESARASARQAEQAQMEAQRSQAQQVSQATQQPSGTKDYSQKMHNGKGNGSKAQPPQASRSAGGQRVPAPASVGATAKAKIGRNDPCFCGSGRKYKQCHGR